MDTHVSTKSRTHVQSEERKTLGTERHMTRDQDADEDWADGGAIDFETVDNSTKMKTEYNSNISTQKKREIQKNTLRQKTFSLKTKMTKKMDTRHRQKTS